MMKTKLKIDNFVDNKLENLATIKGGDVGPFTPQSTGGGSSTSGMGGTIDPYSPFHSSHIPPKPEPTYELPDIP